MNAERLVLIIAVSLARDIEAEDALTRALARSGGDGLADCASSVGLCPRPCLRHRRANVGIWPNWRTVAWKKSIHMLDVCPDRHEYEHDRCQNFGAHLAREGLRLRLADYVQNMIDQGWVYNPPPGAAPLFWSNWPPPHFVVSSNIPRPFEGRTYLFDLTDDEPLPSPPLPASTSPAE